MNSLVLVLALPLAGADPAPIPIAPIAAPAPTTTSAPTTPVPTTPAPTTPAPTTSTTATTSATAPATTAEAGALAVNLGEGLFNGRIGRIEVSGPAPILSMTSSVSKRAGIAFPASADGKTWIVLAPIDIEAPLKKPVPLVLDANLADGKKLHYAKNVPLQKAPYVEAELTVDKQFMQPSKAQALRAQKESKILDAALKSGTPERLWRGSFAKPVPGIETSPFGTRRTYRNPDKSVSKRNRHYGWDLNAAIGDPISATNRGRIVLAADRFYSGGTVIIDHGGGLFTMYFHMSRIDVKEGDMVVKGQGLGAAGASGQVTGPHLHFSVKFDGIYQDGKYLVGMDLSEDALDQPTTAAVASP